MVEAFARGVRTAAECRRMEGLATRYQWHGETLKADLDAQEAKKKDLQRQLEEALAKAEAEPTARAERVAQAKEQGYQQVVPAPWDEHQQAEDKGRDPEEMDFIPPPGEGEGAGDEATNPLDAEGEASVEEGHKDSGEPDGVDAVADLAITPCVGRPLGLTAARGLPVPYRANHLGPTEIPPFPTLHNGKTVPNSAGGTARNHRWRSLSGVPFMAFPRPLNTKEMAEYVVRHFAWDRRGTAFLSSPLPKDFQALCPSYEPIMAKEAA
ncbi:hypothetical protein Cgig2_007640 [Carnegiea gigantea]|uniref:Uncharacterized protein n=1 Tax=Carnegiea gigantea TaxID=171969 RepID=A0A9Q1Q8D7_9CARY|nr:hypothetical protein Cgig2_007640 [Carnegiea gigantea]